MKLIEFKEQNGLSYRELSSLIGVSKTKLYGVCSSDTEEAANILKLAEVNKIVESTRGLVEPSDLGLEVC